MRVLIVKLEQSFIAKDKKGTIFILKEYSSNLDVPSHDEPDARIPGMKEIRMDNGLPVEWIEKGKYRLFNGLEVFSDDPKAP